MTRDEHEWFHYADLCEGRVYRKTLCSARMCVRAPCVLKRETETADKFTYLLLAVTGLLFFRVPVANAFSRHGLPFNIWEIWAPPTAKAVSYIDTCSDPAATKMKLLIPILGRFNVQPSINPEKFIFIVNRFYIFAGQRQPPMVIPNAIGHLLLLAWPNGAREQSRMQSVCSLWVLRTHMQNVWTGRRSASFCGDARFKFNSVDERGSETIVFKVHDDPSIDRTIDRTTILGTQMKSIRVENGSRLTHSFRLLLEVVFANQVKVGCIYGGRLKGHLCVSRFLCGIGSFLGRTQQDNINNEQADGARSDSYTSKFFPCWSIICAPAGLALLGWGWWRLRDGCRLNLSVPVFLVGCILWGYGFATILIRGIHF